jgi:hypothetical protein
VVIATGGEIIDIAAKVLGISIEDNSQEAQTYQRLKKDYLTFALENSAKLVWSLYHQAQKKGLNILAVSLTLADSL